MRRAARALAACGAVAALAGCGESRALAPERVPRQVIVAVDLSGSQSEGRRDDAQRAVYAIIDSLGYDDRLVLLQIHQRSALEEDAVRWEKTFPALARSGTVTSFDRENLDGARQAARSVVETIFGARTAGLLPTTDLFATLHAAAQFHRDRGDRRTTMIFLSDMVQSAHGIEMEDAVPGGEWIARQAREDMVPDLADACVVVIGADATTRDGVAVRDFWRRYLEAAGASLGEADYRLFATGGSALQCG